MEQHQNRQSESSHSPLPRRTTGFPSPAADYDEILDFNRLLMRHPASTFTMFVHGQQMSGERVDPGDLLIVDRSVRPVNGRVVVVALDGQLMVRRYLLSKQGHIYVATTMPDQEPERITSARKFEVWGSVLYSIHSFVYPFPHVPTQEEEL